MSSALAVSFRSISASDDPSQDRTAGRKGIPPVKNLCCVKMRTAPLSVLILKLQVVEAHQVAVLDAHGLQPVEQTALA